uniref:Uncharacterized protein n=1 Tax=Timema poppense TaxID=170557 RepID=A0A7R9H6N2_TIMPO|nr:unnamed protein product [Timema poppensis]
MRELRSGIIGVPRYIIIRQLSMSSIGFVAENHFVPLAVRRALCQHRLHRHQLEYVPFPNVDNDEEVVEFNLEDIPMFEGGDTSDNVVKIKVIDGHIEEIPYQPVILEDEDDIQNVILWKPMDADTTQYNPIENARSMKDKG